MSTSPSAYAKPLPEIRPETKPFWDAARRHELRIQSCPRCGAKIYFPRCLCPHCLCENLDWIPVSGRGTVYSFTVVHQSLHPGFEDGPYVYALIELEEGVRMISNVIGIEPEKVHIGMPVRVVFEDATPEISIPRFQPAEPDA